jgi:hypothetical protein
MLTARDQLPPLLPLNCSDGPAASIVKSKIEVYAIQYSASTTPIHHESDSTQPPSFNSFETKSSKRSVLSRMKVFAANWLRAILLLCLSFKVLANSFAGNPSQFIVKEKTAPLQDIVSYTSIIPPNAKF